MGAGCVWRRSWNITCTSSSVQKQEASTFLDNFAASTPP